MNAETFAEWFRRQGHKVYKTSSSFWYDAGPGVLQAFPYHWQITPDSQEIHSLMINKKMVALRYSSPADTSFGKLSYHIVLNKCYDISTLNRKVRNGVRKGLEHFSIEKITFEDLARDGWLLQQDTLLRQNRQGSMHKRGWENLCISARDLPGFEVFAAVTGEKLAAAAIVCRIDDIFSVPFAMCHRNFLCDHVNNALFYSMSCDLLKRENTSGIFFTVESLDAPANVDEFKLRMGFDPEPVRQNVVLHPIIGPFLIPSLHYIARLLSKRYPFSSRLAKTEGMLRFYLEGKKPLREQRVPECLKRKVEPSEVII